MAPPLGSLFLAAFLFLVSLPANGQAPGSKTIRLDHQGNRISVAFSPDGKYLATGGQDNAIRLWQMADGKLVRAIPAHRAQAGISRLAFPNGKTLASASWAGDGTVKLWDLASGKERRLVGRNQGGISLLAVSPDGSLLAWGNGGKIHLHDVAMNREARLLSIRQAVDSVAFSPNGKTLATANGDGMVRLWEVATGKTLRDLPAKQSTATGSQAVAFSPDGLTLATAGAKVRLWEVASGKEKAAFGPADDSVFFIAFSPDGKLLAAATYKALILWDVARNKEIRRLDIRAMSVAFSQDGKWFAFGHEGGATLVEIKPPQ